MEHYLAELYLSRIAKRDLADAAARLRAAADQLHRQGTTARYVRTILVAEEETCFYLFQADSAEAVAAVGGLAELPFDRVLTAETYA